MTGEGKAQMSASELQLLVQLMDNLGRDMRAGFDRLDMKIDGMTPRTEFTLFQEAVKEKFDSAGEIFEHRLRAVEDDVRNTKAEHAEIEGKINAVDEKVDLANESVLKNRAERAEDFKAATTKFWVSVGLAGVGTAFSLIVAFVSNVL